MPEAQLFPAVLAAAPSPADERLGVYILATVVGLLVSGLISCAKEMRRKAAVRS
jgi:hypothetical protein